jgi:hypothetical protein
VKKRDNTSTLRNEIYTDIFFHLVTIGRGC